jgi:hypothetical protein
MKLTQPFTSDGAATESAANPQEFARDTQVPNLEQRVQDDLEAENATLRRQNTDLQTALTNERIEHQAEVDYFTGKTERLDQVGGLLAHVLHLERTNRRNRRTHRILLAAIESLPEAAAKNSRRELSRLVERKLGMAVDSLKNNDEIEGVWDNLKEDEPDLPPAEERLKRLKEFALLMVNSPEPVVEKPAKKRKRARDKKFRFRELLIGMLATDRDGSSGS